MSIMLNTDCILCHLRRNTDIARGLGTQAQLDEFTRGLLEVYLNLPEGSCSVMTEPGTDATV